MAWGRALAPTPPRRVQFRSTLGLTSGARRVWWLVAIFAGCVLIPPRPTGANIFAADGRDPRSYVAEDSAAWRRLRAVGTVSSDFVLRDKRGMVAVKPGMGTAFLVSPCYAMTNYHVVFGTGTANPDPMADYPVTLRFGLRARGGPAVSVRGRVRVWEDPGATAPDVALIRINGCPGAQLGWYGLSAARAVPGRPVAMPSVSGDRSMARLSLQPTCRIREAAAGAEWLVHDCATREGASGAPLLDTAAGVPEVLAMNAGEFRAVSDIQPRYDPRHANWGVSMRFLDRSPRMRAVLQRDILRAKVQNPLANLRSNLQ